MRNNSSGSGKVWSSPGLAAASIAANTAIGTNHTGLVLTLTNGGMSVAPDELEDGMKNSLRISPTKPIMMLARKHEMGRPSHGSEQVERRKTFWSKFISVSEGWPEDRGSCHTGSL